MSEQRLIELSERLRQLKLSGSTDSVAVLQTELQLQGSQDEKLSIYDMLSAELQNLNRLDEAERVIRERIALVTEIPDGWINLALHFHYYAKEPQKALSTINVALEKAKREGNFYRQAHLERIRIALELKAFPTVEGSLLELSNYEPRRGSVDVRLETEFLSRIPRGAVSESVISNYEAKVAAELNGL